MRNFCPDSTFSCDGFDHLAAGEKWRELLQQLFLSVESADPHRSQHLMSGEGEKIDSEVLDIDFDVRNALCAVADQDHTVAVADLSEGL